MDQLAAAVERLRTARSIVVFSGAGISTDSGIPDFRSPGGIWARYDPRQFEFSRYLADPEVRKRSWQMRRELHAVRARPNAAHGACAALARAGRLAGVITQNIDGLHQDAGLDPGMVVEIHGTSRFVTCLACDDRLPMGAVLARVDAGEEDPPCQRCGGILKAATVSFGQPLPPAAWARAERLARDCDAFLAVGSSLVVYPAAELPVIAKEGGAVLVIINREPTPLDPLADAVLHGEAGRLLPAIAAALTGPPSA